MATTSRAETRASRVPRTTPMDILENLESLRREAVGMTTMELLAILAEARKQTMADHLILDYDLQDEDVIEAEEVRLSLVR